MTPFVFNTPKNIQFGAGTLNRLGDLVRALIGEHIMLVTDPGMMTTGIVQRSVKLLQGSGVEVELYKDVAADPPASVIYAAADQAKAANVAGIVGLGGGSSLDVAKLISIMALGNEDLTGMFGIGNVKGPRLPLILVPTTAGTRSEVTPISIVTTGANEKMGVVSPVILPDIALSSTRNWPWDYRQLHGGHPH